MLHSYDDHAFCPSQKETANNVLEKLSAPKPLCGKWFPKDDTKQMANASHSKNEKSNLISVKTLQDKQNKSFFYIFICSSISEIASLDK